jgi:hypothetical protein
LQDPWHFDYAKVTIRSVVVHGKNDRRGDAHSTIEYDLPRGPLMKLMLAHITLGHALLTLEKGDKMVRLLVTAQGREFSDSTFCHYWATLMASTATGGIAYFRPSLARTMFVEVSGLPRFTGEGQREREVVGMVAVGQVWGAEGDMCTGVGSGRVGGWVGGCGGRGGHHTLICCSY